MRWCQRETFQPHSKELDEALCVLTHAGVKDENFHSPKWPGPHWCDLTQGFGGDSCGFLQSELALRISVEAWLFF